jgi:hypothetical protein
MISHGLIKIYDKINKMILDKFFLPSYKNFHLHIFSCLVYILPLLLIIGPAPADISITILAIYSVFITVYFKRWNLHFTKLSAIILFFNFLIIISSLLSIVPYLSLRSSLFYFRFYFFFIAIYYLINENKSFLKVFFCFFSITLFILIFDSFYQFYFKYNIIGYISFDYRISSFFGSEQILGSYLARLTPIYFSLLYLLFSKNKFFDIMNILSINLFFIVIIFSGERVAIFLNIMFIIIYLSFLYTNKIFKILISIIPLIVFFILLIYFNDNLKKRILNFSYTQIFLSSNNNYIFTNSPILSTNLLLYFDQDDINNLNNIINSKSNINKIFINCEKIFPTCKFTKQELYNLNNLFFNFKRNNFFIEDHLKINSRINLRDIYEKYINFNLTKFHYSNLQNNLLENSIYTKFPDVILQNLHVSNGNLLNFDLNNFINSKLFDQIFFEKKTNHLIFFSPEHDTMIKTALNIFKDNVFFGAGPRMYRYLCLIPNFAYNNYSVSYSSCNTSPHNIYIQLLAEVGLIVFLLILMIFLYCTYYLFQSLYKKLNKHNISIYKISLISIIALNLFPFIPTGNLFGNWLSIIFYLPLGFVMYKDKDKFND